MLSAWAENGKAPEAITLVQQTLDPGFPVIRSRPLCEWPAWPHFNGGDVKAAASFECAE